MNKQSFISIGLTLNLLTVLLTLAVTACAGPQAKIDWHDTDSYRGWITDAATGKPIEGAVVVATWHILRPRWSIEGGSYEQVIRLEEVLTDKDGRFEFAPLGDYSPPLGWRREEGSPIIFFFKPGYEPTVRDRKSWEREWDGVGEPMNNPATASPRKPGWEREVQLFRYLTRPERSGVIDPSIKRTPEQKIAASLAGFKGAIESNVDNSDDPGAPSDSPRRLKAIEIQWRAIVMIEQEMRKYPYISSWNDAVDRAVRNKLGRREP